MSDDLEVDVPDVDARIDRHGSMLRSGASWRGASPATTSSRATATRSVRAGRSASVPGGRSTHGICFGVLSWLVREGEVDGLDLGGLAVAFTIRYDDDEPGSPWSFVVYVDERGSEEQRDALAAILTGRLGGDVMRLPVDPQAEQRAGRPAGADRPAPRRRRLRAPRRHGDRARGVAAGRDRRARQLRHPRPPHRRHRVLRRPARGRRRPVRVGARGATARSSRRSRTAG